MKRIRAFVGDFDDLIYPFRRLVLMYSRNVRNSNYESEYINL
jgi:hypothetical protein